MVVLVVDVTLVDGKVDNRLTVFHSAPNVGGDRPSRLRWWPVRLRFGGPSGGERGQHDLLEGCGVLGEANHPALTAGEPSDVWQPAAQKPRSHRRLGHPAANEH